MSDRRTRLDWLQVVRGVAALAIGGGAVAIGAGALSLLAALTARGLEALGFAALGIGLGILGGVLLVVGLLIRVAVGEIRSAGPDGPAPTPASTLRAALATVVSAGLSVSPAVAALGIAWTVGPSAVPGDTGVVAALAIALGLVLVAAAWTSRYLPDRALGVMLILAALLPCAIPAWMTSQIVTTGANARHAEEYRDRYADLADGPSVGEIVADVGQIGSWRPVGGAMYPDVRYDEWFGDEGPIADFAGKAVRVAVLGQCRVEGAAGDLSVSVNLRSGDGLDFRPVLTMQLGPCDGVLHAAVSERVVLPDWAPDVIAHWQSRDYLLLTIGAVELGGEGLPAPGEHASRWLGFVSLDPPTSVDELQAAVARAAGSFNVPYSE